jgi:hypothetical protein
MLVVTTGVFQFTDCPEEWRPPTAMKIIDLLVAATPVEKLLA